MAGRVTSILTLKHSQNFYYEVSHGKGIGSEEEVRELHEAVRFFKWTLSWVVFQIRLNKVNRSEDRYRH